MNALKIFIFISFWLLCSSLSKAMSPLTDWTYRVGDSSLKDHQFAWLNDDDPQQWLVADHPRPTRCQGSKHCWMRIVLPDISMRDPVIFVQGVDLVAEFYLDGRIIGKTGDIDSQGIGKFFAYRHVLLPLPIDFQQRTLMVRLYSNHTNIGLFETGAFLAEGSHVFQHFLSEKWDILFVSAVLAVVGFAALITSLFTKNRYGLVYIEIFASRELGFFLASPCSLLGSLFLTLVG